MQSQDFLFASLKFSLSFRCLIENGASINSQACCGATALHFTADTGNLPMIKLLVEYGKADLGY